MKNFTLTIAILSTFTLIGCGGGGGNSSASTNNGSNPNGTVSDPQKIYKVEYTLNGSNQPTCHNAYYKSGISSSSTRMSCQWLCGEYEGASPVHVLLAFEKNGGVWEFTSDSVSTTALNCHK